MVIDFDELDRLEAEASQSRTSVDVAPLCLRWAVNIASWQPSHAEFQFLLLLLPEADQTRIKQFRLQDDQKRALVSRFLQRAAVVECLGIAPADILIQRTKGQKPFLATRHQNKNAPNFNFNVSHEGEYVVLATENLCIVGVDVSAPQQIRRRGKPVERAEEFFSSFGEVCSTKEWAAIRAQPTDALQLAAFRRHWSLKEAFVKARGDGLGFEPLKRAEFDFGDSYWGPTATVNVDGHLRLDWRFDLQELEDHWISVARGPPSDVVDANGEFVKTFRRPQPDPEEYQAALDAPASPFQLKAIEDLLPAVARQTYLTLRHTVP